MEQSFYLCCSYIFLPDRSSSATFQVSIEENKFDESDFYLLDQAALVYTDQVQDLVWF